MDNNEKDIIEKDIVNDVFGNVEESYDVPVYEPIMNNSTETVNEGVKVEEVPVIEDVESVPTYTVDTTASSVVDAPAFEESAPIESVEVPVQEVNPIQSSFDNVSVEPIETPVYTNAPVEETIATEPIIEEVKPVEPIVEENTSNEEYNYDIKPEVEEVNTEESSNVESIETPVYTSVPVEETVVTESTLEEEPVPFAANEVSSGVEHPDAKVILQKSEEENETVSKEDVKINLNDNASLKFVLIIGIIIFIAIMVLPLTNLI